MKSEDEIRERVKRIKSMLDDVLGDNIGGWDTSALQDALSELKWVLND